MENIVNEVSKVVEGTSSATTQAVEQAFGSPTVASPIPSKHLDFGGTKSADPASPATPALATAKGSNDEVDYNQFVQDTLLWRNRVRSALYLLGGLLLIYGLHAVLTSKTPFVTGVCFVLLLQIGLNSVRAALAPSMQARATWADSAWTQEVVDRLQGTVATAATLHDVHLSGANPSKTLKIALFLWFLSLAARQVAACTILTVVLLGAFSLPLLYTHFKKQIDDALSGGINKAKAEFTALDRRLKAVVILVPLLLIGYLFSRTDTFIAIIICVVYARVALKPAEMEKLTNGVTKNGLAKTITATANKAGAKVAGMTSQAVAKYELTPGATPARKKAQ